MHEHLRREIVGTIVPRLQPLWLAGPAPAPLARAETYYRHQIMLRTRRMSLLSQSLAALRDRLRLPEDLGLSIDIDPANLL
jgi:primosomal protein N'